jgi:4'-phosphopantetheinyl transferase
VDAAVARRCHELMAIAERERHARFAFERHRHEYAVTRGLERGVLARYVARPPGELSFRRTEHGRPLLEDAGDLRFNLTNCVDFVACAVVRGREIGVDAEPVGRGDEVLEVGETVFTRFERERLSELPLPSRRRRAVQLWTQKEAYMKARGLGMSLPVERFEVVDSADGPPTLRFLPPIEDVPARWALETLEIEGHFVSICVEVDHHRTVAISTRTADLRELLLPA